MCYLERENSKYINIHWESMATLQAICLRQNSPDMEKDEIQAVCVTKGLPEKIT